MIIGEARTATYADELLLTLHIAVFNSNGRLALFSNRKGDRHFLVIFREDDAYLCGETSLENYMNVGNDGVEGWQLVFPDFVKEVVLPIRKDAYDAHQAMAYHLRAFAEKIYGENDPFVENLLSMGGPS